MVRLSSVPGGRWLAGRIIKLIDARAAAHVDPVVHRIAELEGRVTQVTDRLEWLSEDLKRVSPQVASLEARVADAGLSPDQHVARAEIEHMRTRVRMQAVSHYEDRIRAIEERISALSHEPR